MRKIAHVHGSVLHRRVAVVGNVTVVQFLVVLAAEVYASLVVHRIRDSSVIYSVLPQLGGCLSFGNVGVRDVSS